MGDSDHSLQSNPDAMQIEAGRIAWQNIRSAGRKSYENWVAVGKALVILRSAALKTANTNRPFGTAFRNEAARLLREAGLDEINHHDRFKCHRMMENLQPIQRWRDSLSESAVRRLRHPGTVWVHWQKSLAPQSPVTAKAPAAQRQHVPRVARHSKTKSIFWSQDALRRAHQAMLLSRSSDLLTLARVALQAAIRTEADLLALLPADPPAKKPRQIAQAALELQ
jgi:hypothetical protein